MFFTLPFACYCISNLLNHLLSIAFCDEDIRYIAKSKPENEKIEVYLEHVQLFFEVNGINKDKQVPVLLNMICSTDYALLSNLVSPGKPKDKTLHNSPKCS